ncbi:MAG: hypothetical protein A2Y12_05045 [Planctomycetes bacterium GWF2_42_9]|nr:MAG: hypothetical protein A2Y12_05045 [Planctomycetes bacterium GWF2_42_9]
MSSNSEVKSIGIIKDLAELPLGAIISEDALAKIFDRHQVSVKRAVERKELPPSVRLFGEPVWTAGTLIAHLEKRLRVAADEQTKLEKRIGELTA